MSPRIRSIVFDKNELPQRASISTQLGTVKVEWTDLLGDRCWFTSGEPEARKLAVSTIERIERLTREW